MIVGLWSVGVAWFPLEASSWEVLCTFNFPWLLKARKHLAGQGLTASDPRCWFYSLSLLSLECFCWEAPVCVARAERPRSRNIAKPLASGKCLFGGNSVGYFFFFFTCYNEWVNGTEQSCSKAEPRGGLTADGEPGLWPLPRWGNVQHFGDSVGQWGSHGTYFIGQFLLDVRAAVYYYIFFLCDGTVLLKMVGVVWKLLILYRITE